MSMYEGSREAGGGVTPFHLYDPARRGQAMRTVHEFVVYAVIALIWPRRCFRNYRSFRRCGYPLGVSLRGAIVYGIEDKTIRPDDLFTSAMQDMWGADESWMDGYNGD